MRKPDFFLIGAPKAGTTALAEYLGEHPRVFFSDPKEPHFFNDDFANRHTTLLADYLGYFEAASDAHHAVGEGSVFYLSSGVAVRNVLAFQPEARFIVMLRNPVDMAYAWHSQALMSFGETEPDFEQAWRLQGERRVGRHVPTLCREPRTLMYGDLCLLGRQVRCLYQQVAPERVKVVFFDDFTADTRRVYDDVLGFLGVASDGRAAFVPANTNKAFRSMVLERVTAHGLHLKRRLGIRNGLGLATRVKRANTVIRRREPLRPAFEAELRAYFHDDVLELADITGRDLAGWTRT